MSLSSETVGLSIKVNAYRVEQLKELFLDRFAENMEIRRLGEQLLSVNASEEIIPQSFAAALWNSISGKPQERS